LAAGVEFLSQSSRSELSVHMASEVLSALEDRLYNPVVFLPHLAVAVPQPEHSLAEDGFQKMPHMA